jgi:hypothetical protein
MLPANGQTFSEPFDDLYDHTGFSIRGSTRYFYPPKIVIGTSVVQDIHENCSLEAQPTEPVSLT